jgi:site-specific DNA recombinase
MRAVIYARYSSDLQSEASIEDQIRLCRERVEQENGTVVDVYADYAISGKPATPERNPQQRAIRRPDHL